MPQLATTRAMDRASSSGGAQPSSKHQETLRLREAALERRAEKRVKQREENQTRQKNPSSRELALRFKIAKNRSVRELSAAEGGEADHLLRSIEELLLDDTGNDDHDAAGGSPEGGESPSRAPSPLGDVLASLGMDEPPGLSPTACSFVPVSAASQQRGAEYAAERPVPTPRFTSSFGFLNAEVMFNDREEDPNSRWTGRLEIPLGGHVGASRLWSAERMSVGEIRQALDAHDNHGLKIHLNELNGRLAIMSRARTSHVVGAALNLVHLTNAQLLAAEDRESADFEWPLLRARLIALVQHCNRKGQDVQANNFVRLWAKEYRSQLVPSVFGHKRVVELLMSDKMEGAFEIEQLENDRRIVLVDGIPDEDLSHLRPFPPPASSSSSTAGAKKQQHHRHQPMSPQQQQQQQQPRAAPPAGFSPAGGRRRSTLPPPPPPPASFSPGSNSIGQQYSTPQKQRHRVGQLRPTPPPPVRPPTPFAAAATTSGPPYSPPFFGATSGPYSTPPHGGDAASSYGSPAGPFYARSDDGRPRTPVSATYRAAAAAAARPASSYHHPRYPAPVPTLAAPPPPRLQQRQQPPDNETSWLLQNLGLEAYANLCRREQLDAAALQLATDGELLALGFAAGPRMKLRAWQQQRQQRPGRSSVAGEGASFDC